MKNQSRVVHAEHAFFQNSDGTPKTKTFPRALWDKLPEVHQYQNGQKIHLPKGGWVEKAPEPAPLKKPVSEVAADTTSAPKTQTTPVAPSTSGGGVKIPPPGNK